MAFTYIASILIFLSWYIQTQTIYKGFLHKDIFNRDLIEHQLNKMSESISTYKYNFWMFQYTVFAIAIVLLFFKEENLYNTIFLSLTVLLLLQYVFEYMFIMNLLKKHILDEIPVKKLLDNLENKQIYNLEKTMSTEEQEILKKEWNKEDEEKIKLFMINSKSGELKKDDNFANIYNEKGTLFKLDLSTGELFSIKEVSSDYTKHFYEVHSLNRIYNIGILEPLILSILLILGGIK